MEIKILGGGCSKCERLEKLAREAASEVGVEATFTKVKQMSEIMTWEAKPMIQIKVFGTMPPCANCKRAEAQAQRAAERFPGQVEVVKRDALGPEAEQYGLMTTPLVVGDLVKFVGLAPSRESLVGALREAGLA